MFKDAPARCCSKQDRLEALSSGLVRLSLTTTGNAPQAADKEKQAAAAIQSVNNLPDPPVLQTHRTLKAINNH